MTAYQLDQGEVGVYQRTLTAGQEDTVAMPGAAAVRYLPSSATTEPLYVRRHRTAPASSPAADGGSPCLELLPGDVIRFEDRTTIPAPLRLWSAGAVKYSVGPV